MYPSTLAFRKSSYSGSGDNCVEVADLPAGGAAVRDTQNREAGYLAFSGHEWDVAIRALRQEG